MILVNCSKEKDLKMKFNYYRDAGHGWVAVKRSFLEKFDVLDQVSKYSYQRGKMVYLEQDCDMTLLFEGFNAMFGYDPELTVVDHGNNSWVRSQENFVL